MISKKKVKCTKSGIYKLFNLFSHKRTFKHIANDVSEIYKLGTTNDAFVQTQ